MITNNRCQPKRQQTLVLFKLVRAQGEQGYTAPEREEYHRKSSRRLLRLCPGNCLGRPKTMDICGTRLRQPGTA
jgi:hypothetical protein